MIFKNGGQRESIHRVKRIKCTTSFFRQKNVIFENPGKANHFRHIYNLVTFGYQSTAMLKILFTLLFLYALEQTSFCQNKNIDAEATSIPETHCTSVDALAAYIKQNFTNDMARIRAIYVWVANHISYDVKRFLDREKNPGVPPQPVTDVLATRSAVCQGYSDLFVTLCKSVGINAIEVGGYTKFQGKVNIISHAWVAAQLAGQWYLFDPTWGAGYVSDDNRFTKKFNNSFYKVQPDKFISDHMPFDPLFQFLSYPLTNKEFINATTASTKTVFRYSDTLEHHVQLSSQQQMAAELRRMEAAGIQIDLLLKRQQYLKTVLQSSTSSDAFEEGGKAFNTAMDLYKQYMGYKNNQFGNISDTDLKQLMDNMESNLKRSRSLLLESVPKNESQRQARANNVSMIDRFWPQLTKEKQFVQQYLSKADASARKQLFVKR